MSLETDSHTVAADPVGAPAVPVAIPSPTIDFSAPPTQPAPSATVAPLPVAVAPSAPVAAPLATPPQPQPTNRVGEGRLQIVNEQQEFTWVSPVVAWY